MSDDFKILNKKDLKKKGLNQEKIWDFVAKSFPEERIVPTMLVKDFLENKKGRVIDLGCGNCKNMIPNKNLEYYGVDFSKKQLETAKKHLKKHKIKAILIKADIENLSFMDNFFDYGLIIGAIHCLETKEKRENTLKEFYRILKPNAEALISVWDSSDPRFANLDKDIYMSWKTKKGNLMRYYYLFDKQEIIDLLEKKGFKILKFYDSDKSKDKDKKDRFSKKNWVIKIKKM
jgi:ubiquinone/menaquinone biosynthesis C-methylase UbiE